MMTLFLAGVASIAAAGILSLLLPRKLKAPVSAVFSISGSVLLGVTAWETLLAGTEYGFTLSLPFPLGSVTFAIDALSAFFILVMAASYLTTVLYSIGYFKFHAPSSRSLPYFFPLALLFASMFLLVVVRQTVAFLFLWEIMSLSSFFLVSFEHEKEEARKAGLYYLAAMQAGFAFLLLGFLLSGSADFSSLAGVLSSPSGSATAVFLLLFSGFAVKAGFVPFHTWLPKAHPAAPAPVSAAMSGTMIKMGIYGLLRMVSLLGTPPAEFAYLIIAVSLLSGVLGAVCAVSQRDLKKLLAYSSIENVGIIGLGIGVGMLGLSLRIPAMAFFGFLGGFLHVLNHMLFKGLLFMGAGSVYTQTHTLDMEKMGGLVKTMPRTAAFFLCGALAISGLPLLNGFVGEFSIYLGMLNGLPRLDPAQAASLVLFLAALALIGILALFCFVRAFGAVFLGLPRENGDRRPSEKNPFMLIAQFLQAAPMVVIGLFPQITVPLLRKTLAVFAVTDAALWGASAQGLFNALSTIWLVFIGLSAALLLLRALLLRRRPVTVAKTWDCGYQRGSGRLQYTAGSFAHIVRQIFKPLTGLRVKETTVPSDDGGSAGTSRVETSSGDVFEKYLIRPAITAVKTFFRIFLWIQSGNTRQYILYGVVFLLGIIIFIFGFRG